LLKIKSQETQFFKNLFF